MFYTFKNNDNVARRDQQRLNDLRTLATLRANQSDKDTSRIEIVRVYVSIARRYALSLDNLLDQARFINNLANAGYTDSDLYKLCKHYAELRNQYHIPCFKNWTIDELIETLDISRDEEKRMVSIISGTERVYRYYQHGGKERKRIYLAKKKINNYDE